MATRDRLFFKLLEKRILFFTGTVDDELADKTIASLLYLEAEDDEKPITMFINSPGGSVTSGMAVYDVMKFIKPSIRVVCSGLTASIATIVLLGAKKGERMALPHSKLLIHQPLIPMTVYGPASDLEITAQEIIKTRERINSILAEETGHPLEKVKLDTERDYWMTATEAIEYGLISRIVKSRKDI